MKSSLFSSATYQLQEKPAHKNLDFSKLALKGSYINWCRFLNRFLFKNFFVVAVVAGRMLVLTVV